MLLMALKSPAARLAPPSTQTANQFAAAFDALNAALGVSSTASREADSAEPHHDADPSSTTGNEGDGDDDDDEDDEGDAEDEAEPQWHTNAANRTITIGGAVEEVQAAGNQADMASYFASRLIGLTEGAPMSEGSPTQQ